MTIRKFVAFVQLVFLVVGLSLTTGCNGDTVTITYRQVANWRVFVDGDESTTSLGGQSMYLMYKITSIQNTGATAKDFSFKVRNTYANCLYPPNASCPETLSDEHNVGYDTPSLFPHAYDQTVKAGNSANNLGCIIIWVGASDPQSNELTLVDLHWHYDGKTSQLVNITREDTNTTVAFASPGTPKNLNQLCTSSS